ncbi:hypothetical protein DW980_16300 [Bacteroides stercoris]|nr:hypothetical protein DW980_16300 [Bacteroides stercoris]
MVDKKRLREMSQDVLVIPFTEEMADKLDKFCRIQIRYLQPIITQYFIDNKSEIWLLFLIAHSKR